MDADLDTLATAVYARTDDLLKSHPERVPSRPRVGIVPQISDAELVTMAVMQALLGFTSEARWLRHARTHCWATRWVVTKRAPRVIEAEDGWSSRSMSSCATAC